MPVTDLFISYGDALAPAGFRKVTLADGGQAELNRGVANSPSYLWCHHSPTRGDPIVELMVVTVTTNLTSEGKEEDNNDNCPKNFEKNPRNMLYGSDKCAYLCFRRSKDVDPIGQLRVLYGDNSQPDEGFTRLGTPVYSGTTDSPDISSIYLSYATISKDTPVEWSASGLTPGDKCDIEDSAKHWHLGEVMSSGTTQEFVRVALINLQVPRNITLPRSSTRLAAPGENSSGQRAAGIEQGTMCEEMSKDLLDSLEKKLLRIRPKDQTEEAVNSTGIESTTEPTEFTVWKDINSAVEVILMSAHPPQSIPRINSFLKTVLTELVRVIKYNKKIIEAHFQLLRKLLFLNDKFTWYYTHYGAGVVVDDAYLVMDRDYILTGPAVVTDMNNKGSSVGGQKSAWGTLTSTISSHFKGGTVDSEQKSDKEVNLLGLKLLVTNVNHFAAIGGIDALIDVLVAESISNVYKIVSLMKSLSFKLIRKTFLELYLPKLQQTVSNRLLTLDDSDYREIINDSKKDYISMIWIDLEILLRHVFKDIAFFEIFEKFTLNYSEKLISCQMLNLRIKGMNVLIDVIDRTVRKESSSKKPSYSLSHSHNKKSCDEPSWLTTSFIFEWLQQRDLLKLMLGNEKTLQKYAMSHTHDEILKKSQSVLLFHARQRGTCSDTYLTLLWQVAGRNTPSSSGSLATSRISFNILCSLVPYFSHAIVSEIQDDIRDFQKSSLTPSMYTDEYCKLIITLVKVMLEHSLTVKKRSRSSSATEAIPVADSGKDTNIAQSESNDDVEFLGLDILWTFLIDHITEEAVTRINSGNNQKTDISTLFTTTQLEAAQSLAFILSKSQARSELNMYLEKCISCIDMFSSPSIENTSSSHSTCEDFSMGSILLLKRLIEIQGPPRPAATGYNSYYGQGATHKKSSVQELSRALIIRSCEKNHQLLHVIIEYIGKCINWKQVSDIHSDEYIMHTHKLQVCMELLQVVLNNSDLELTVIQVTGLWEGFSSGIKEDMNMFFNWLHMSCPVVAGGAVSYTNNHTSSPSTLKRDITCCMTDEALLHVFLDLLGKRYEMSGLSECGYEAIEKIFRYINGKEKFILYSSNKANFQVASQELIGFDVLLKAYVFARDLKTAERISKFIVSLQVKLSPAMDKRHAWTCFTTVCLNMLQKISRSASPIDAQCESPHDVFQLGRVLLLLQHFFNGIYKSNIPVAQGYHTTSSIKSVGSTPDAKAQLAPLRVTVFWKKEGIRVNNNAVYVFKKGTVTVGSLRSRLASDMKVTSSKLIRLVNAMRVTLDETHEDTLLESIGISSFVDMTILLKPQADTLKLQPMPPASILADDPDSDQMAPRKLVADDSTNLSIIFELLSLPDTYSKRNNSVSNSDTTPTKQDLVNISNHAWGLLALLPTNPGMLQEVETLGGVLTIALIALPPRPPVLSDTQYTPATILTTGLPMIASSENEVNWNDVLSTDGLLRLHYKLKIVREIILPLLQHSVDVQFVAKEVIQKATEWSERFIDKGGVECLIKLIMNSDVNDCTQGNLVKQCISLRIELLAVFLKQRPTLLNADDGVGALVKKLIMFLQIVILGNDDDESAVADDGNSLLCEEERPVLKRIRTASTGSLEPPTTNSSSSSVQKLEKKRTRRARFEKYFVSQLKDTSAGENSFEINVPVGADDESECSEIIQDVDALLVDNVMSVLRIIYYEQPTVLTNVILDKQCHSLWEDILFVSLLQSPSSSLRESMSSGVLFLCESCDQTLKVPNDDGEVPQLSQFFFGHLLLLLPHSSLEMVNCAEYFKLLSDLVGEPRAFTFRDIWRMNDIVLDEGEFPALAVVPSLSDQRLASQFRVNVPFLFETLVDMVFDHNVHEKSEEDDDIYFQGLLLAFKSFLTAIVCSKNNDLQRDVLKSFMVNLGVTQHLIEELFHNCLFSNHYVSVGHFERVHQDVSGKIRYPKCKSAVSRKNAFDLLNILSTESSNFDLMLQLSRSHHLIDADGKEADDYCEKSLLKYSHAVSVPKSSSGYVGILNPSCVCYLNSTLQQLFHVTSFRRGILETTTESSLGSAEAKNDMMLQLQFLFASLQESDQAFVDPKPFCFSFKDWDGRPTNVSIQQDASEFLAKFFQQVENAVMGSHSEGVLKDTFLGTISNELLATAADGTLRRSERPEPFYVLSVPVGRGTSDGNHCLTDALTSFISGEQVDYTWETEVDPEKNNNMLDIGSGVIQEPAKPAILKEHLPTTKRASIKQLPNHLIIHLKRFDFNFETMQQIKINDKFSYPEHLDMFPYTVLGRQEQDANMGSSEEGVCPSATSPGTVPYPTREECQYVLAGVVVHVGTAHSGHYYSLVKDRNSGTSTSWFELNDSFVSEFDIDDLESETFGGVDDSKVATQVGSAAAISAAKDKLRTKNAFLLVYDRVLPNKITEITVESDVRGALVPASILESIQKENLSFWNTKSIFDPMYYGFLTEVVLSGAAKVFDTDIKDLSPGLMYPLLDFIVNIIFGTFAQAKSLTHVKTWSLWLVDRMRRRPALAYWLLQMLGCVGQCSYDKKNMLCALLLNCEEKEIRLCGKKIVSVAIVIVASDAQSCQPLKSLQQHENNSDYSDIGPVLSEGDSVCLQVVDHMMCNLLGDAQCKWRNIDVFFAPISVLAKNSATCCAVMQKRDYLATLLSFFLCQDSPYPELVSNVDPKNVKARAMCEGNQTADFSSLLGAVGAILLRSDQIKLRTNGENDIFSESTGNDKIESEGCSASISGGDVTLPHSESYSMSSKSLNMMRSSIFMYRLLKVLGTSVTVPIVLKILQFVLKDSKELTEACTKIIISAMKKEDGIGLKAPIRCAMVLCQIKDSIQGWRVSYVMQQVVIEIKSNIQYVQATDTSITMFLRICKHAPASVEWFRLNYSARLTWLENYLLTRKGGILPQKSMLWKPIKTASGSNSKVVDKSPQGIAAATAAVKLQAELNLQLIKRVVNKGKVNSGDGYSKFFSVKFSSVGVASGGYDSDDDPADLVGVRIQVQWKSTFYPGEVASFDIQSNLHMVHFDDGEKVACNLRVKVWSLLID